MSWQTARESAQSKKNPRRRENFAHRMGARRDPTTAPTVSMSCALALAPGFVGPASSSAQSGIHWTEPHVPMSATAERMIPMTVLRRRAREKMAAIGYSRWDIFPVCTSLRDWCQRSDSGTKKRMRRVMTAGAAPTRNTQRHDSGVTGIFLAMRAMRSIPQLAAVPMAPAK